MRRRWHITRFPRAVGARLCALVLACGVICGCQSNSERDFIARDRRMREDQIYALQDYIQQYQRLVCQYRSENAALRRQLSEGFTVESQRTEPDPYSAPRNGTTPKFQSPQTPANKVEPSDLPAKQLEVPPIEVPEVPPLKTTSANELNDQPALSVGVQIDEPSSPQVLLASYEEPPRVGNGAADPLRSPEKPNACDVMVCGEVVANELGGGPRLMIDVVPFDEAGKVESFAGKLSLVITGADAAGKQTRVCGWEFGPDDVRAAVDPNASEPTMRFYVELPTGTTINGPAVLWARLVPPQGMKLFAHAKIDLGEPGVFSSNTNKFEQTHAPALATDSDGLVAPANFDEPLPPPEDELASAAHLPSDEGAIADEGLDSTDHSHTEVSGGLNKGTWAVAAPGKPANLPAEARDESGAGGWRASSEPISAAIVMSSEGPAPQKSEPPQKTERRKAADEGNATVVRPNWAAERGSGSHRSVATRPGWSATR